MTNSTTIHISLTGHRPGDLGGYNLATPAYRRLQDDLEQYIRYQLENHTIVWGHSGLALGADTIWSMAILEMKKQFPERVKFYAEIPMMSQYSQWFKTSDIDFWHKQVAMADEKTVYAPKFEEEPETQRKASSGKILMNRNIGMVDHADVLLAVAKPEKIKNGKSGTGHAINYGKKADKEIVYIDANNYF